MNINFLMPTEMIMGKDCVVNNASVFSRYGKKAMLVTGCHSAKENGSQEDVLKALATQNLDYVIFDKIMANPTIDIVYEGAAFARENQVDFIVGIGGGSPMDAAKGIALLAAQDISRENLFSGVYDNRILPMIFIPTTSGTGSEVTKYSILTNDEAQTKTSIASPVIFPKVAMIDAKYTESVNLTTTINTAIDALSHSVEGMLCNKANAITNLLAKDAISKIAECFTQLQEGIISSEAREKLIYASALGGIVISQTGTTAVHAMGYSLTYFKHVDHGRANGLLLGEFLEFVEAKRPELIGEILECMNCSSVSEYKGIMDRLLGQKETITQEEIEQYSKIAIKAKNIPNSVVVPTQEDLIQIFQKSF
ncbi:MAG: iron-containing alcohol dehydrogenase [Clostridiales bacterium]|nr:iron-containing alcohol dehydrogenase [Clostridiales bacterium]